MLRSPCELHALPLRPGQSAYLDESSLFGFTAGLLVMRDALVTMKTTGIWSARAMACAAFGETPRAPADGVVLCLVGLLAFLAQVQRVRSTKTGAHRKRAAHRRLKLDGLLCLECGPAAL